MKITAAVTERKGAPFELQELELGELRPDEVLVKVAAAGICHTDLIVRDQWYPVPLPAVLGHEGAGTVERVGPAVTRVVVGDRVAMSFDSCGDCPTCLTGRPSYCHDFFRRNFASSRPDGSSALSRDGELIHAHYFGQSSFATHAVANERNVVKLDDAISLEVAAPFGCGIQTGAGAVLNVFRPLAGSSLAVFGTGATHVVDARERDALEAIKEITGTGVDFSLEATASPQVFRQAVDCTAPTGVCGLIGAPAFGTEASLDVNNILVFGRTIRGIVEGDSVPELFLPRLVQLWEQGRFPVERIMTSYDFDAINEAARDAESGKTVKPVLVLS